MTDDPTVKVTAQLVEVARDFTARRGDKLMVVAGVCIGLYTGEAKPATPPAAAPAPKRRKQRKATVSAEEGKRLRADMREKTLAALRAAPGRAMKAADIIRLLGLEGDWPKHHYRTMINAMLDDKTLQASGHPKGRTYTLTGEAGRDKAA
jgi:hypothetical protein